MYKHILLPLDGSELSLKAVREGIALAKLLGSRATLITVVSAYHGPGPSVSSSVVHELERRYEEEASKETQNLHAELIAQAQAEGVQCDSVVVSGDDPAARIVATAEARDCDLIVMGSHGRRGLNALLLGSETAHVLTHTKIRVLVVH